MGTASVTGEVLGTPNAAMREALKGGQSKLFTPQEDDVGVGLGRFRGRFIASWNIPDHRSFEYFEEKLMPRFVTIGYGDQAGYDRTAPDVRNAAHTNDEVLKRAGALMGIAGKPVQVRNPDAKGVNTVDGAFMASPSPIAGFAIVEANNLAEAIELISKSPCAVAHGVVEVWPLIES
jgi:hypothetical protein